MQSTPTKRRYADACGTALALDIIGERWALLVVRELMFGALRFSDLRESLPGISANVLTQRLDGLEKNGVLFKRKLPPPVASQVYELTAFGYAAESVIMELGRWAVRSPLHDPTLPVSATSIMLSLRTLINRNKAGGRKSCIGFRIGEIGFVACLADSELLIQRNVPDPGSCDAILSAPNGSALAAFFYSGLTLEELQKQIPEFTIEGDQRRAVAFGKLFELPSKL